MLKKNIRQKNSAYWQHLALWYMCDSGVHILYHEYKSIPLVLSILWVHFYTISSCLFHESMSIPWVYVYTKSPYLYHEYFPKRRFIVNTMSPELQKLFYRNTNYRNTKIQITEMKITEKLKFISQKHRTTNYKIQ